MAKICPSCGYHETDNQALYCNKCGYPFPQSQPRRSIAATLPASRPAPRTAKRPTHKRTGGGGFFSFGTLITGNYLNLIYILGAVVIVLFSVVGIVGKFAKPATGGINMSITNTTAIAQDPAGSPLFWIGFLIAGSILWRMFCELFVVLSRVHGVPDHGREAGPDDETADYGDAEASVYSDGGPAQLVECPKCRKIVPVEELRECEHCGVQGCSNCIRPMGLLKKTMTCRECFEGE
jgi:hypothetical protein